MFEIMFDASLQLGGDIVYRVTFKINPDSPMVDACLRSVSFYIFLYIWFKF